MLLVRPSVLLFLIFNYREINGLEPGSNILLAGPRKPLIICLFYLPWIDAKTEAPIAFREISKFLIFGKFAILWHWHFKTSPKSYFPSRLINLKMTARLKNGFSKMKILKIVTLVSRSSVGGRDKWREIRHLRHQYRNCAWSSVFCFLFIGPVVSLWKRFVYY